MTTTLLNPSGQAFDGGQVVAQRLWGDVEDEDEDEDDLQEVQDSEDEDEDDLLESPHPPGQAFDGVQVVENDQTGTSSPPTGASSATLGAYGQSKQIGSSVGGPL